MSKQIELKDLYELDDETMYDISMKILSQEIKAKVEKMLTHNYGLNIIEHYLNEGVEKFALPKEIAENVIRGLRWKYLQLMPTKQDTANEQCRMYNRNNTL